MSKKGGKIYWDSTTIDGKKVYIQIHIEPRRGTRMSFGKEYILLRIPSFSNTLAIKNSIAKCKQWVEKTIHDKPDLISRYHTKDYELHPTLTVMGTEYRVILYHNYTDRGNAKIEDNVVYLEIPTDMEGYAKSKMIRSLLSKIFAKASKKKVRDRLDYFNSRYIGEDINRLVLKYNTSNWGSCSTNNNINISTRTLLAPLWVLDYVLVHELCHLKEMNHSSRFWSLVASIYPEYKEAELWLNLNGSKCYF